MAKKLSAPWSAPEGFLGLPESGSPKFSVIPAPFDSTASYGTGARFGPSAIIEASKQVELFDLEAGREILPEIETLPPVEVARASPEENAKRVRETVESVLKNKRIPILLGGDHSIAIGAILALPKDVVVVSIDAHGDLRDEYEGSRFSHACVMKRAFDSGKSIVEFGTRAISKEEFELVKKNPGRISLNYSSEIREKGISASLKKALPLLKGKKVYLSIDIDGFDPSVAPGTGTPEPGGLSYWDGLEIIRTVCRNSEIVGLDVNEVIPDKFNITNFLAAKLVFKAVSYIK